METDGTWAAVKRVAQVVEHVMETDLDLLLVQWLCSRSLRRLVHRLSLLPAPDSINASVSSQSHSDPQEALKMAARRLPMLLACLAAVALLPARATESDQGCADGWSKFGSRCFKFFNEKKTWTDAEKSCHTVGANLPSVHSLEENNFILDLIKTATGSNSRT
ncbi:galactose-specific lectin nattectin-like [Boleophthalmus pectinirostris]|uniref:galactose-specific lectin nattectin-like n=1 Tax=Boleophthalmus pectinirostris TaxID=150288 RepID=UPI0024307250|nr:galactose-specific lectin nattectin-like [Boleophthalmus pectinirostris]